ncbi:MAG: magnesium transporter, partial [Clostridia bacterium]|nr:magnesium transporter [Clostridia bacterium]
MATEVRNKIRELLTAVQHPDPATGPVPQNQGELQDLLESLHPYDVATVLHELDEPQQLQLLALLPARTAAEVLEHLDHDNQYRLLDHSEETTARAILAAMSKDAVVDLIGAVHPRQGAEILRRLPAEDLAYVRQLMQYPENSAGGRATVDYIAVRQNWTAEQVIAHFRKVGAQAEVANYFYVVDQEGRLVGVTSMRQVLLADPKTPISEIAYGKVVSVPANADQEEAAQLLSRYDFVALPVVDGGGRMIGVITADDIIDVIEEEATEDIHKLG